MSRYTSDHPFGNHATTRVGSRPKTRTMPDTKFPSSGRSIRFASASRQQRMARSRPKISIMASIVKWSSSVEIQDDLGVDSMMSREADGTRSMTFDRAPGSNLSRNASVSRTALARTAGARDTPLLYRERAPTPYFRRVAETAGHPDSHTSTMPSLRPSTRRKGDLRQ